MIDVHAHVIFDGLLGGAGELGPRIEATPAGNELVTGSYRWPLGERTSGEVPAADRVEALDRAGIDVQVLSLSPLWFFHHISPSLAVPFTTKANDLTAAYCAKAPDRLLGVAALPAQDVPAAVRELSRSVRELGLVGAYMGTDARERLDDPDLDPLYAACVELDVPLVLHSTILGIDGPSGDPRLERWLGQVTIGYPYEETLAVQALVFGGVLDRHPDLDILLPHGGGALPFLHGRLRSFAATANSPISVEQFDATVARLWFDSHVHSDSALDLLRRVASPERIVFGSNFSGWDEGSVDEVASFTEEAIDSATRLFRLDEHAAPSAASVTSKENA